MSQSSYRPPTDVEQYYEVGTILLLLFRNKRGADCRTRARARLGKHTHENR